MAGKGAVRPQTTKGGRANQMKSLFEVAVPRDAVCPHLAVERGWLESKGLCSPARSVNLAPASFQCLKNCGTLQFLKGPIAARHVPGGRRFYPVLVHLQGVSVGDDHR